MNFRNALEDVAVYIVAVMFFFILLKSDYVQKIIQRLLKYRIVFNVYVVFGAIVLIAKYCYAVLCTFFKCIFANVFKCIFTLVKVIATILGFVGLYKMLGNLHGAIVILVCLVFLAIIDRR